MREHIQEIYAKFAGKTVFIVGGGYSVQSTNIEYLHDKNVIAINDSYKLLPNASALFWCDASWAGKNSDGLKEHKTHLRFNTRHYAETHIKKDIKTSGGATVLHRTGDYGFDPNIDNVMGNNGGVQCLNFVLNLKPQKIYLIGYDMRDNPLKPGETHWHNYHTLVVKNDIYTRQFIPSMIALYKQIQKLGITTEIINCSRTSAIACFPKKVIPELTLW